MEELNTTEVPTGVKNATLSTCRNLYIVKSCVFNNRYVLVGIIIFICVIGLLGNGTVLWFLCFRIKRNPFMVYILNLAAADFGVLAFLGSFFILAFIFPDDSNLAVAIVFACVSALFFLMQCASIHLLTAISFDRCLAVFFPMWHRYRRPTSLSAIVSAVLWILSTLLSVVMPLFHSHWEQMLLLIIIISFSIFSPFMVISTLVLFIKVCLHARLRKQRKLHMAILLSLFFFIITMVPLGFFFACRNKFTIYHLIALLFTSLNSSINPIIYFLIGRQRSNQSRNSMKVVLQRVFKEETDYGEKEQTSSTLNSIQVTS